MIPEKDLKVIKETLGADDILDELVHECFSQKASGVNNDGIQSQVEFLLSEGWFSSIENLLSYLGCIVEIEDGKYVVVENSGHTGEEIVGEFNTSDEAFSFLKKQYTSAEMIEQYHVKVAVIKDGVPYYEF